MEPRQFLDNPEDFGKVNHPIWKKSVNKKDIAEIEASRIQHLCALEMRRLIKEKYKNVKTYCSVTKQEYQRVSRILRGALTLTVEDLGYANIYLGLSTRFNSEYTSATTNMLAGNSHLRDLFGAFYTPQSISQFLIEELCIKKNYSVLEPCFGDGSFIQALLNMNVPPQNITAIEVDKAACNVLVANNIVEHSKCLNMNFLDYDTSSVFNAVVGNPPYVRLRKLSPEDKTKCFKYSSAENGLEFGEDASEWLPFLIKATKHVIDGGSLGLVLPFEITYVKYANKVWDFLCNNFGDIFVYRVKERIFPDILQDVVLLICKRKGSQSTKINYSCYMTINSLLKHQPEQTKTIPLDRLSASSREFQRALVNKELLTMLDNNSQVITMSKEAKFHIGYVCGNKDFFHPSISTIEEYNLPTTSLHKTILSSKDLKGSPLFLSQFCTPYKLWKPTTGITESERNYIEHGEQLKVNHGYKCKIRNPWWITPLVKTPDIILTVFTDIPRAVLNDSNFTFSNSLLGGYLFENIEIKSFIASWYTAITLLSFELEVHALGGGVLVAVPNEVNRTKKLQSSIAKNYIQNLFQINEALLTNDIDAAYHVGDLLLEELFGATFVNSIWKSIYILRSWRKKQ